MDPTRIVGFYQQENCPEYGIQLSIEIAWNHFNKGKTEVALATILECLEVHPGSSSLQEALSSIYNAMEPSALVVKKEEKKVEVLPKTQKALEERIAAIFSAPVCAPPVPNKPEKTPESKSSTTVVIDLTDKPAAISAPSDELSSDEVMPPRRNGKRKSIVIVSDDEEPTPVTKIPAEIKKEALPAAKKKRRADAEVIAQKVLDTKVSRRPRPTRSPKANFDLSTPEVRNCARRAEEALKKKNYKYNADDSQDDNFEYQSSSSESSSDNDAVTSDTSDNV